MQGTEVYEELFEYSDLKTQKICNDIHSFKD